MSATALVNPNGLDSQRLGNFIRTLKVWDVRILMVLVPKGGTVTVAKGIVDSATSFSEFEILLSLA